jgi:hypothetical protein
MVGSLFMVIVGLHGIIQGRLNVGARGLFPFIFFVGLISFIQGIRLMEPIEAIKTLILKNKEKKDVNH